MARIISTSGFAPSEWKARVTCGNPLCRAVHKVDESDLYLVVSEVSDPVGGGEPLFDSKIALTCPVCGCQDLLWTTDVRKIPSAIARRLPKKSTLR